MSAPLNNSEELNQRLQNLSIPLIPGIFGQTQGSDFIFRVSGVGLGITGSALESFQRKPLIVSTEGMKFNIGSIERDVFYEAEYDGQKYAIRVTADGVLENYEVREH